MNNKLINLMRLYILYFSIVPIYNILGYVNDFGLLIKPEINFNRIQLRI